MPAEVSADEPEESLIVRAVISGEISQRGLIGLESGVELLGRVEMGRGAGGGGAPPPPPLAPTLLLVAATRRDFAKPERCARAPNRRPMQSHRAR